MDGMPSLLSPAAADGGSGWRPHPAAPRHPQWNGVSGRVPACAHTLVPSQLCCVSSAPAALLRWCTEGPQPLPPLLPCTACLPAPACPCLPLPARVEYALLRPTCSHRPASHCPLRSHSILLDKRLLIEGEGRLEEATIDQRANVPTFKLLR